MKESFEFLASFEDWKRRVAVTHVPWIVALWKEQEPASNAVWRMRNCSMY